jgi:hypothetical protein
MLLSGAATSSSRPCIERDSKRRIISSKKPYELHDMPAREPLEPSLFVTALLSETVAVIDGDDIPSIYKSV